ncbi:MAG: ATP-binding protein [Archangium sp.]|nr:ATP-binding protein [Archangium sp.]
MSAFPHFTSLYAEGHGPIRAARLGGLTRLHALIGPNDSGKSKTLEALKAASLFPLQTKPPSDYLAATKGNLTMSYRVREGWQWIVAGQAVDRLPEGTHENWASARTLRLDPDHLRAPLPLLTDSQPLQFANDRGQGLGALLDAVFARSKKNYLEIEKSFIALFPTVEEFSLSTTSEGRRIGVKLRNGPIVGPEHMSEGMLYFLAFALVPYLAPTSLLLIEEPENGLHPARIGVVMKVLREISKTTQVVLATHSPLVVNELQPDEVTLVTRTEAEGTKFTPIASTPNFAKRSSVYALGELWLSYADGISEAPLFESKATGTK